MNFLWRVLINAGALWVVSVIFPGLIFFRNAGVSDYLVAGLGLGLANAVLRPVLLLFTLPLNVLTLGLFTFVVNAVVLLIVANLTALETGGFFAALLGSILLSFTSSIIGTILGDRRRERDR
jgi:putative membrane protein